MFKLNIKTYFTGILSDSLRIVIAESNNIVHVAPYPGLVPLTLVINTLFGGSLCLSVGSTNFSVHPSALNVMENLILSSSSGLATS